MAVMNKVDLTLAQIQGNTLRPGAPKPPPPEGPQFNEVLEQQLQGKLKFSAHAQRRLQNRQIDFGAPEASRLEEAVDKAAQKGARESLILIDDLALIVSIQNRTVITAIDGANRKENIFTNIDSVVMT